MSTKKQPKKQPLTWQEAYDEANRYMDNAKDLLQRAGKEGRYYLDTKYVRMACGTAHLATLIAYDTFLALKGVALPKKRDIEFFRRHIATRDRKLLDDLNYAYEMLHLLGYYEGMYGVAVIKEGMDTAADIIARIKPVDGSSASDQPLPAATAAWRGKLLPIIFGGALLLPSLMLRLTCAVQNLRRRIQPQATPEFQIHRWAASAGQS
jgi:hypothetical protein